MRDDYEPDERQDALSAQAAAIAPALHAPQLSPEELNSLAVLAMGEPKKHAPRASHTQAWSRRRVGYASAGALLVTSTLVVVAILGLQASTSSHPMPSRPALGLPVLKVRGTSTNGGYAGPNLGYGGPRSQVTYKFLADPNLSTATGSAAAYALASPTNMAAATGRIAEALGLSDTVTYLGPDNYNGGPSGGPDVTVDTQSGVLNWLYPTWSGNVHTTPSLANPTSIAVNPNAPLPTDGQATTDAEKLLEAAGVGAEQLGTPTVSRYAAGVNVAFQVVAGGIPTDQQMQVEYGPGATVLTASGIIATTTPKATYPTISPTDAVGLLTNGSGDGDAGQPIVTVDIAQATLTLATYVQTDGTVCFLPTWELSGSENGSGVAAGSTYTGSVLAIPAQYVQPAPTP